MPRKHGHIGAGVEARSMFSQNLIKDAHLYIILYHIWSDQIQILLLIYYNIWGFHTFLGRYRARQICLLTACWIQRLIARLGKLVLSPYSYSRDSPLTPMINFAPVFVNLAELSVLHRKSARCTRNQPSTIVIALRSPAQKMFGDFIQFFQNFGRQLF